MPRLEKCRSALVIPYTAKEDRGCFKSAGIDKLLILMDSGPSILYRSRICIEEKSVSIIRR